MLKRNRYQNDINDKVNDNTTKVTEFLLTSLLKSKYYSLLTFI